MENRAHLQELVDRYLDGTATTDELEVFVHLQKQGLLDELLNERLDQRIHTTEKQNCKGDWVWLRPIAATASLILVMGLFLYLSKGNFQNYHRPKTKTQVMTDSREIKTLRLIDGSQITLNRNSAVQFLEDWDGNERLVELIRGEAFFDVQKTIDQQPFLVKTPSGAVVRVLGTEFNVSGGVGETLVYLHEGRVRLQTSRGSTALWPGNLATYSRSNEKVDIRIADSDRLLAWKNNLFVFEDAGLTEVARELEDYFGITIELPAKAHGHLRFTGKISRTNMDTVLAVISETLNLKVTRQGPNVKFQI